MLKGYEAVVYASCYMLSYPVVFNVCLYYGITVKLVIWRHEKGNTQCYSYSYLYMYSISYAVCVIVVRLHYQVWYDPQTSDSFL